MGALWFKVVLAVLSAALVVQGVTLSAAAQPTASAAGEDTSAGQEAHSGPDREDDNAEPADSSTVSASDAEARMLASSIGSTTEGIGERRFFTFDEHELTDRMAAKVNVANGNLLISATDLAITGTGIDANVQRFYNSLTTDADTNGFGPGWSADAGPTVRLTFPTATRVVFVGPSGYRVRFDENGAGGYTRAAPGLDANLSFHAGSGTYRLLWHSKQLHVFNSAGRLLRVEDKQGNQITYSYDGSGRLDTVTDTQGRDIEFAYHDGRIQTITDVAGGRVYDYDYEQFAGDPTYRLAEVEIQSYGLGTDTTNLDLETSFDYDADGRLVSVTDVLGRVTQIDYVPGTRRVATLTRVTASSSEPDPATGFTYHGNDTGCPSASAVARTVVDGPRTDVTDTTTYCVDSHDRVVDTIDAKGHPRSSTYTANSNVASFNDSGGAGLPFVNTWDASDNLREVELPTSGTASADYTDANSPHFPTAVRDFASSGFSTGATWAYDYDPKGHLIEAKNTHVAPDAIYRYCYTGLGQLQRIDAPPVTVALDNNTSAGCGTGSQGNDTLFSYDAAGNLTKVDPPGPHGTQTFTHDALSRVATMTDGRGVVATYTYDALDRITSVDYTQPAGGSLPGATSIDYEWDAAGNQLEIIQPGNESSYDYDELNRVIEVSTDIPYWETEYSYDTAGNLTGLDGSDEPDVTYTYDNLNRVTSVTDQKNRTTSFGYDTRDNRTSTAYPNGVTMRSAFDASGRMACTYAHTGSPPATGTDDCPNPSTSLVSFFGYDYTSPRSGNPDTTMRHRQTDRTGQTTTYTYDMVARLRRARTLNTSSVETKDYQYSFDARGNITRETVTGNAVPNEVISRAYTDASELCWSATGAHTASCGATPGGATSYSYDDAGNLASTSDGMAAGYTLAGQTAQITPPGGAAFTMAYTGATSDLRHQAGNLQMSHTALGLAAQGPLSSGTHSDWFVRDPDGRLVAMINRDDDSKDAYYVLDALDSVVATTDKDGNLVNRYTYEPYGEQTSPNPATVDGSGDPVDRNPFRFASGYYDTETGLLKYGTRYYMPDQSRWTQPDPILGNTDDPMTLNPYLYVGGNPINSIDPTGALPACYAELIAGGVAGGATGALAGLAGGPAAPVTVTGGAVSGALLGALGGGIGCNVARLL